MLMLSLHEKGKITAEDDSTRDILKRGFYGKEKDGELQLGINETLYLLDVRNAECSSGKGNVTFGELSKKFWKSDKFMARYFTYKDWRDRGLVAEDSSFEYKEPTQTPIKKYPSSSIELPNYKLHGLFFKSDLITIINEEELGKDLYEKFWFGQYGAYKASERGQLNKLDIYETLYLIEKGILTIENLSKSAVVDYASRRRKEFLSLYEVYKDWRNKGYVIKTGFKFGTHFRVYFPGAKPASTSGKGWTHSQHVIHVFPKNSKLLISEWARVIRVAHSVRKTFILAVPGKTEGKSADFDFVLYHRHGGEADNPENAAPKFAMLSLSEEEYIGGLEFASAIGEAKKRKLELLLAIADRETSVTYYKVRQILLPKSEHEYYEIDWMQP